MSQNDPNQPYGGKRRKVDEGGQQRPSPPRTNFVHAIPGQTIIVDGTDNTVIIGNGGHIVTRGCGVVKVVGSPQSLLTKGMGHVQVNGDVNGAVRMEGMGRIDIHGNVNGNMEGSGVGLVTVYGDLRGALDLRGYVSVKILGHTLPGNNDARTEDENIETFHFVGVNTAAKTESKEQEDVKKTEERKEGEGDSNGNEEKEELADWDEQETRIIIDEFSSDEDDKDLYDE